ncbi:MAG: NAD(P)-dependent alcohol dehydrogenase [Hyphomicrobiales bacterium]|nr:NAD(P)-dependent alcohol dehydrogenase [Hyphomicrobiales bacterium]MCP5374300.1 NAD(P)-dependent alcohol dehydrogenase [Hyphomicrobiales bacterium]
MKVWELKEAFGLDNLKLAQRADPRPGPGQVVVAMRAASINFRDLVVIKGGYGRNIKTPLIPFSDGAGVVEAVGPGVTRVAVGDRVCPLFFQGWPAGDPPPDVAAGTLGGPLDGALAEKMLLDQQGVAKVPDSLSDAEAACLPCAALTAWSAIVTKGCIVPGQTVVVQGTGGVALFALQIAKAAGARVIITSSSDEKLEKAKALGADVGINYRQEQDWSRIVKEQTHGVGADHVVELGGADTLNQSVRAVRGGGTISLIGVLSGAMAELNLPLVLTRNVRIQGITVGSRAGFEAMLAAMDLHGIKPVIDSVFPFDRTLEALSHLAAGAHFGKVCIDHTA